MASLVTSKMIVSAGAGVCVLVLPLCGQCSGVLAAPAPCWAASVVPWYLASASPAHGHQPPHRHTALPCTGTD